MVIRMRRFLRTAFRIAKYLLPIAAIAGAWWFYRELERSGDDGTISGLAALFPSSGLSLCERTAADGTRYQVNTALASYRLEMRPEDSHSRRVFPSYGAALRYARQHRLPSIPSAPLVLATCAATDTRLQSALELALDDDPGFGRRELLRQWLAAVLEIRGQAAPAARAACDRAITYLATALQLQGETPQMPPGQTWRPAASPANDPPLGPWATRPELGVIWHRDRFLATLWVMRTAARSRSMWLRSSAPSPRPASICGSPAPTGCWPMV